MYSVSNWSKVIIFSTAGLSLLTSCSLDNNQESSRLNNQYEYFNTPDNREKLKEILSWLAANSENYRVVLRRAEDGAMTIDEPAMKNTAADSDLVESLTWWNDVKADERQFFFPSSGLVNGFFSATFNRLDEASQDRLTNISFDYGSNSVTVDNQLRYFLPSPFSYWAEWYNEDSVTKAFRQFLDYKDGEGVQWSAEDERFVYESAPLLRAALIIAASFWSEPQLTKNIFKRLPQQVRNRFSYNTQENTPASKTEPFDLIQGEITRYLSTNDYWRLIEAGDVTRIMITKLVHASLHNLLDLSSERDPWGANLDRLIILPGSEDFLQVFCAGDFGNWENPSPTLVQLRYLNKQRIKNKDQGETIVCGDESAVLSVDDSASNDALQAPSPYNIQEITKDRDFHALVTFALSDETTPEFLQITKRYMKTIGWDVESESELVDTKSSMINSFKNSDVYIPIAHVLNVSDMHIGSDFSHEIVFAKSYELTTGETKKVFLTSLFPKKVDGKKNYLKMSGKRLRQLLMARRVERRHSMIILNASCQSAKNTAIWTNAYRDLRDSISNSSLMTEEDKIFDDLPHVFGSQRNFPTSSASELVSNFAHPLTMIDSIMEGKRPHQLLDIFNSPVRDFYIDSAARALGINRRVIGNAPYKAVYNVADTQIMQSRTLKIKVEKTVGGETEDFSL